MKYKLLFVLVSAIYASSSLAGTSLGTGASTSDGQQAGVAGNSTAIGANAWASDYSGLVGLNGAGSVAVGANSAAQGQGVAIGVGAQSFSQFIDNDGNYRGVAIGAGALSLGNGVALGAGTVAMDGTVNIGGRTLNGLSEAFSLDSAVNLGQVQTMFLNYNPVVNLDPLNGSLTVGNNFISDPALGDSFVNAAPTTSTLNNGLNINIGAQAGGTGIGGTAAGFNNLNLGTSAGFNSTGNGNITQGFLAGVGGVGDSNVSIGNGAGGVTGNSNVNVGDGAGTFSDTDNSVNVGRNTDSEVNGGVAIGNMATVAASATNSVALGQNSLALEANTVSVGSVDSERRITNVADPINGTDAVNLRTMRNALANVGQNPAEIKRLDGRIDNTNARIEKLQKRAFGGTALAMAMAGAAPDNGHDASFSVGTAIFDDQGAIAASLQLKNVANGATVGLGWGVTTQRDFGVRATITWQWNPTITKVGK